MRHESRSTLLALALAVLAVAGSLPHAAAADPQAANWSPERVPAAVTAVALAKENTTLAVGNARVEAPSGPNLPVVGTSASQFQDFRVFDVESGRIFNSSESPQGKRAVAVSRDGAYAAAGGAHVTGEAITYYRVPAETQEDAYAPLWTQAQPGTVASLALTGDGQRLVVTTNEVTEEGDTNGYLRVYDSSNNRQMQFVNPGRLNDVAVSADGRFIVAGGAYHQDDDPNTYGVVYLFRFPTTKWMDREIIVTPNASEVRDVAMTPDGTSFAALTTGGQVLTFENRGTATPAPAIHGEADVNMSARGLAMSEDGRLVLAGLGSEFVALARDGTDALRVLWNTTFDGTVTSVDASANGRVLLAGVAGAAGGVHAFSPDSATPYWRLQSAGATNVTVTADGRWVAYAQADRVHAARLPSRVSLLFETSPGTGVPNAPFATTEPFKPLSYPMLVRNDGAYPERVTLTFPNPPLVKFQANRSTFDLDPGEVARVEVTVTPQRLNPGTYAYNVTASASDDVSTNATVSFQVAGQSAIRADMQRPSERRVAPGDDDTILLSLTNEGNDAADVTVGVTQDPSTGDAWGVHLVDEESFTMSAGGFSTVRVLVQVPPLAVNGSQNRITLTVTSPSGSTTTDVLYKVNPFLGVNLTVPGRTKFVYGAGDAALFNVTVMNTGSVQAQFALSHQTESAGGRNWVTGLDVTPFSLKPGENVTQPVRVFAPRDGEVGDRASVLVEVRSIPTEPGLHEAYDNLTLYANLLQPREQPPARTQEERPYVPGPGLLAVGVALAGVAALTQRRRSA